MYQGLLHTHSGLRYIVLLFLVVAFLKSLSGWLGKKDYSNGDNKLSLFAMIFCHVQLLVGILLYVFSPIVEVGLSDVGSMMSDPQVRFFTMEHGLMMILALALITIGRSSSKKIGNPVAKHKRVAIFYGLGLLIIFVMIPWPFLKDFGNWF